MKTPLTNGSTSFSGRGDLIRFLCKHGEEGLDAMAGFAGYERKERKEAKPVKHTPAMAENVPAPLPVEHRFIESDETKPFWYVSGRRVKSVKESDNRIPEWAKTTENNPQFSEGEVQADYDTRPPLPIPLVAWSRIWPLLRGALGSSRESRDLDMKRLIERVSRLEPLKQLPLKSRFGWGATGCLILDFDDRLLPLWGDLNQLHLGIEKLRGRSGFSVYMLEEGPEGAFKKRDRRLDPVLTPCSPVHWDDPLVRHFSPVWWDRGNRSFKINSVKSFFRKASETAVAEESLRAERLLKLLSPAIRVEPELLRAVRISLPCAEAATEILAWNSPFVDRFYSAYVYDEEVLESYREAFKQEPEPLRRLVIARIEKYHSHLSKAVLYEEKLIATDQEGTSSGWADQFIKTYFRTLGDHKQFPSQKKLEAWFHRLTMRLHRGAWERHDILSDCWLKINLEAWERGDVSPPEGVNIEKASWQLLEKERPETYAIRQIGEGVVISGADSGTQSRSPFETGSHVAFIRSRKSYLSIKSGNPQETLTRTISLREDSEVSVSLPESGPLTLATDMDEITLDIRMKPRLASSMGRDARGLYVKLDDGDDSLRIDWPEWSERGDVDEFGLYAEFDVGDVLQRMRWINPGTFMMGSPDDEPERQERERWHRVTLTRGFWLADTACTQALWEAVMGKNPNRSKWKKRPVEEISWDDCMEFIRTLNNLKSGLDLRLPTEAEWEYACRAGTGTPFSLGNNITPDQVNYNGEYPYAGAEKGNFIGESVDVGSIPANPWGLYEMHGNVWEWCSDWFDDYPVDAVVDPVGPETGVYRVLRGGSWIYDGRDARSAYRNMSGPGNRSRDVGFRLARGQKVGGAG